MTVSTIYHYCSADAFVSILKSGRLWVSDARKTNDTGELDFFKNRAIEHLKTAQNKPNLESLAEMVHLTFELIEDLSNYYICCFSEDNDSVPQWSAYAERGTGFAIGLNVNELRRIVGAPLINESYELADSGEQMNKWGFGPVTYDDASRTIGPLKRLIDIAGVTTNEIETTLALNRYIDQVCAFFKNPAFQTEKEWRLIYNASLHHRGARTSETDASVVEWRHGRYGLTPYCKTPSILPCIDEIVIGPGNINRNAEGHVYSFIKAMNVDAKILKSTSPYR